MEYKNKKIRCIYSEIMSWEPTPVTFARNKGLGDQYFVLFFLHLSDCIIQHFTADRGHYGISFIFPLNDT